MVALVNVSAGGLVSDRTEHDVVAKLPRNIGIGVLVMFVVTVLIALPAGLGLSVAVGVAVLPAVFAGPFIGGLMTVVSYQLLEGHNTES